MRKSFVVVTLGTLLTVLMVVLMVSDGFCQHKSPVYGGVLREIRPYGPKVLSYFTEMGPQDVQSVLPAAERLMDYNLDKQLVPFLAESVTVGKDGKSITFRLRKGIKFHDGSDLNAEAVAWNFQLNKDTKRLQFDNRVLKIEVVDDYTVRLHITQYNNQLLHGLAWFPIFSKQAWDKAGGGNTEKSKEWSRANIVGTGPFKLAEFKRDNYLRWVRNENYWQAGKPYLDGILVRYIPEAVTASAMMQAKEADLWALTPLKDQADLEKKGFVRQSGFGFPRVIYFNNKDPNSRFQNKKLREAVEYALDKPAIARAMGFGYYTPLTMVAPAGEWGYDPTYKGRPYDPAKARQLLAEAGYPNGLKVKLLATVSQPWPDEAQALKRYLDEAGIHVDLDMADPGRFFSSLWNKGWDEMALFFIATETNFLVTFHRQFGPEPQANYVSFRRPPELIGPAEKSLTLESEAAQKEATKELVRLMSDEALVVPLYNSPNAFMMQPYVHTTYLRECTNTRRHFDEWMEKH